MHKEITIKLKNTLNTVFGFEEFRPGQLEALLMLMQQGRLLCIQPTGYGKSLLYQLPAVLLDGITVVISPLLALMRDQLQQLKNRFGIAAASFNTDQSEAENAAAKQGILRGNIRILFIAPEQLDHIDKFNFLLQLPISLLVVDEAHCISTWGHDFRPSYRQIIKLVYALIQKKSDVKLLALTATANKKTETDIKTQLTVDKQKIIVHRESMDRPNIRLSVLHTPSITAKLAILPQLLKKLDGSGIIYCATRENTEVVAEYLSEQGIKTIAYHAGIDQQLKRQIQHDFIHDKHAVISATNALGMGIDKANLRFIVHFDFPGSITAYYQEVGRAGRDGLPAEGILLYDKTDHKIQRHFIEAAQPKQNDFQLVLSIIAEQKTPPNLAMLKTLTGLHPTKLTVIIAELVEQNFIKKESVNGLQVYKILNKSTAPDLARYEVQYKVRINELFAMQRYAEQVNECLMLNLRTALGDQKARACGQCSGCTTTPFVLLQNTDRNVIVSTWLNTRIVPIILAKKIKNTETGIAVLDGKLRSDDFVSFMRERAHGATLAAALSDNLLHLITDNLQKIAQHYKLGCIISIPSTTWVAKDLIVNTLAEVLKIPVMKDILYWHTAPKARQGELLNNDQRKNNVAKHMKVQTAKIPSGAILLFDDYTGSGATLDEAARVLREHGRIENKIIPFTIAAVKWRLGKRGMI